jgi:hypothetical protein
MARYAMVGERSRELLSWHGLVLIHHDRAELEYLFAGVHVVPCPSSIPDGYTMSVGAHPALASVTWPLTREQFRR